MIATRRAALAFWLAFLASPLAAATHTVTVAFDTDVNAGTGCSVALPGGGMIEGAEVAVDVTVETTSSSATVTEVNSRTCNGGSFDPSQLIDDGDWPLGLDAGDGDSDAIEAWLPMSLLGGTAEARVWVVSESGGDGDDAMLQAPGGGDILLTFAAAVAVAEIPTLSEWALLVLSFTLLLLGWRAAARGGGPLVALLIALLLIGGSAGLLAVVGDGELGDWTGQSVLGSDPAGDSDGPADLVSFYAKRDGATLWLRVDAAVPFDGENQAPVAAAGGDQSITLPDNGAALAGSATDDGLPGALTFAWSQLSGPEPALIVSPDEASTDAGFGSAGTYVFRLTASDGSLSDSDDVTVTVNAETNGPPVLQAIDDRTLAVGERLAIAVAANDPNPTDTLTWSLTAAPGGAAVDPAGSPNFQYTPTLAQVGPQAVTVRVQDGSGASDTEAFVITVVDGNQPPVLGEQLSEDIPAAAPFSRTLEATDPDLPGDTLTFALLDGPDGMTLTGGLLEWTPGEDDLGVFPVTVAVSDPAGAQDQARFALTVRTFVAPVARDDAYETSLGGTLELPAPGVLGNDVDPEGGTLAAEKISDPGKGSVTAFGTDGSFTYEAPPSLEPPPPLDVQSKWLGYQINSIIVGTSPLAGDFDGDGKPEILFRYPNNCFAAVNEDGTTLFTQCGGFPAPNADCVVVESQMALGDIDDDGQVELVMAVGCQRDSQIANFALPARVAAWSWDSTTSSPKLDWLSPSVTVQFEGGDGNFYSPHIASVDHAIFTIARLDPEEPPSVLWGHTYNATSGPCSNLIAGKTDSKCRIVTAHSGVDGTMTRRFYFAADESVSNNWGTDFSQFLGHTMPVVSDIDGDGEVEVVADGTVWNLDGTVAMALDGSASSQPQNVLDSVVADLDGDGSPEIITAQLYDGFGNAAPLSAWHADGTLMWRLAIPSSTVQSRMTVGDLDRDGSPEILFSIYNTLYAIRADGHYKWARTFDHGGLQYLNSGGGFSSRFAVYDLNGDGIVEVIVQDGKNDVLFLRGDTGETQTSWHYVDPDHPSEPSSGAQAQLAPTVADLDGDGHTEVVLMHDINVNNTYGVVALEGIHEWRAAPRKFNQRVYMGVNVDDDGGIPAAPPDYWADPVTNVFGQQPPEPYVLDPRERTRTTFQYVASNAALDSDPATVTIDIRPQNRPPVVTSTPPATAASNVDYRFPPGPLTYQITAVDPDVGDAIAYALMYRGCGPPEQVTVSSSGLFSYAAGNPGNNVLCLFAVDLTDGNGGLTSHVFSIFFTNETRVVPDLVGDDQLDAPAALSAVDLILGKVVEMSNAAPAGEIIDQSPGGGTTLARGSAVDLIVSTGPEPQVVPNVVGRQAGAADGLLIAGGFTTGDIAYEYDPAVPRDEVLEQDPAGGSVVLPGPVDLTVSAGSGLELRLDRSVTTTDVPIGFEAVSFDLDGEEGPAPPLDYVITPVATPYAGSLPTVDGDSITFSSDTRGAFRITGTDSGTGRSAFADFAVAQPRLPGVGSQMEQFALLTETLEGMDALFRDAKAAVDAGDEATAAERVTDAILLWRSRDGRLLRLAVPFSPEGGFPPGVGDLPPGVVPGPDDLINHQLLEDAEAALAAWTAGLRAEDTSLAELETLAGDFIRIAHLQRGLVPGEYGTVLAAPEYAVIAAHRIPDLMDAITDELAVVVGLPPAPMSAKRGPAVDSTLIELLVAQAVNAIADKIVEAKKYTTDVLKQAVYGAAIVAVSQHLKSFVQGQDLTEVVSGASLSFRLFEAPYSYIEGRGLEREYPDLNTVYIIGPQLFLAAGEVISKIKASSKHNLNPEDSEGEPRYENLDGIFEDLKSFNESLEGLQGAAQSLVDEVKNANQDTKLAEFGCVFTTDPTCVQLHYPDGFKPVYKYAPPEGLSQLTGLPLPILFMVRNNVNGQILFATPLFLPTPP